MAIPVYLLLLLFPPLLPVAFYGINGYLLGREYFKLAPIDTWTQRTLGPCATKIVGAFGQPGAGVAFLFTVPIVNLATPVIAASAMVHVFKFISGPDGDLD